ncbi:ArnT family glycosyltransferase [Patescibacteria group bacterium]
MSKKLVYILILFSLIAIGALLRFYNLEEWLRFANDELRDLSVLGEMLETGNFIVLGPEAGIGHFHFGPIFFYLLLPAAYLGGVAPLPFAITAVLFSLGTIPLLFYLGKKLYSPLFGLFAAGLFAVSYLPVIFGRWSWNPHYLPFFVTLFLLGIVSVSAKNSLVRNLVWAGLAGIGFGVAIQLHFLALLMGILLVFFFVAQRFYRRRFWLPIVMFIAVVALLFLPALIYDLQNNWQNTKELTEFLGHSPRNEFHDDFPEQLSGQWNWFSLFTYYNILGKVFGENLIWQTICTIVVLASAGFALVWGIVRRRWRSPWWGIALFIVIVFVFSLSAETEMHVRYLEYVLPFVLLWIVYLGFRLAHLGKIWKYLAIVLAVVILAAHLMTLWMYYENLRDYRYDMPYVEIPYGSMGAIVDFVVDDAGEKTFRLDADEVMGYKSAFQWIVEQKGFASGVTNPEIVYRVVRLDEREEYKDPGWGMDAEELPFRNVIIRKYQVPNSK